MSLQQKYLVIINKIKINKGKNHNLIKILFRLDTYHFYWKMYQKKKNEKNKI